ncbi:MAG TPA: MauE/DoxX family redox-associated membrane protein [Terriglobales bacterium]|nr:MauE/DoxX family redox-associated membrane protein [Terriglobales bacterium]
MKELISNKWLVLLFRLIVGITFLYASLDKIVHPDQFARIVYNYKILPGFLINIFAITLPWVELLCGVFLILGLFIEGSSTLISLVLVSFIIALSVNFLRGVDIACGCFTTDPNAKKEGAWLLLRDVALLLMSLQILFFNLNFLSLQKVFQKKS